MEQFDMFGVLRRTGVPVTYREWPINEAPELPYIIFTKNDCEIFEADNVVYMASDGYDIEICTAGKDEVLEKRLEEILTEEEIVWEYTGEARTTEGIYIVSMNV